MTDTVTPSPATSAPADRPSSTRKRQAILDAAEVVFSRGGYLGANMDDLAARSGISKQTIYKYFGSKEGLFVDLVTSMTTVAGDPVHDDVPDLTDPDDVEPYLADYAERQLILVMTPRLLQLRRLVIGEVARFPALAAALYEHGPQRATKALTVVFAHLAERRLLQIDDPAVAAVQFNWLVMGEPVNAAMLLGDAAIPDRTALTRHAQDAVRLFLAAHAVTPRPRQQAKTAPP